MRNLPRVCPVCYQVFHTYRDLQRHMQTNNHFGRFTVPCQYCHRRFTSQEEQTNHVNREHYRYYRQIQSAFGGRLQVVERIFDPFVYRNTFELHRGEEARLMHILNGYLNRFNSISATLYVTGRFATYDEDGGVADAINVPLSSRQVMIFSGQRHAIQARLALMMADAQDRVDALELQGSGYTLRYISRVSLHIARRDFAGGRRPAGRNDRLLVPQLTARERECVTDVKSHITDGCLFTATAQAFLPQPVLEAESDSRYHETAHYIKQYMNIKGLPKPTPLSKIKKFEKQNSHDLDFGINVYMKGRRDLHEDYAGKKWTAKKARKPKTFFYPIYVSDRLQKCRKIINLLLIDADGKGQEDGMHFMYIHDLDRLLGLRGDRDTVCPRCLQKVGKAALQNHLRLCSQHAPQILEMPEPNEEDGSPPLLEFKPGRRRFLNPIIAFCDFESINVKEEGGGGGGGGGEEEEEEEEEEEGGGSRGGSEDGANCKFQFAGECGGTDDESGTSVLNAQEPVMYCMLFVTDTGRVLLEKTHSAESSKLLMKQFYADLASAYELLGPLMNDMADVRPKLTRAQEAEFYAAEECWICEKPFQPLDVLDPLSHDPKVLDHSHSSLQGGRYLGAAHRSCNSGRQHQRNIPIFIHNLTNYDGMFLLHAFSDPQISDFWTIDGIPMNTEKFRSLTIGKFQFLDSFHFLSSSLAKLVEDLVRDGHQFSLLQQFKHGNLNGASDTSLLTRKSCYPYDYVTSLEVLKNSRFPAHEHFYNKMQQKNITAEAYQQGKDVYDAAGCVNLEDYTLLYNRLDVYLLAEVMLNFRRHTYEEFRLDVSQFLSAPHLAFNIMLLLNRHKVELVTDVEMHLMVESGLRGGVTHASLRHVKLDEPYAEQTDPTLMYTDCVNLYGHAMRQKLPAGEYAWLSEEEMSRHDWSKASDDDDYGYIIECDLEYPKHLHDLHNSLPLAPEQREIDYAMLSEYTQYCFKQSKPNNYKKHKAKKLCTTFYDKENYIVHSRNLALYLRLGMKLKKVKRAIRFKQAAWLRSYIDLMTAKRQLARSIFEKNFYKLLINSIYGKLVQNVRKQMSCSFIRSEKQLARALANPCFEHFRIIGERCAVFFNKKRRIRMFKPYIAGFSVLDISKCHMYSLFYDCIKPMAPSAEVVLTDTDSLLITIPDMTKPTFLDKCGGIFDFSNYPPQHSRFSSVKKMMPGFLKDENGSKALVEVVALKAKVYAIRTEDNEVEKKCKGISKRIVERDFTMDTYLCSLQQVSTLRATSLRLRSKNFKIDLIRSRKIGLTTGDDKRFLLPCGIHTLAYGSYRIKEQEETSCHICGVTVEDMRRHFASVALTAAAAAATADDAMEIDE